MNGRLCRRAVHHAFLPDELLTEPPVQNPRSAAKPERRIIFQAMLDTGQARNRAEVARLLGCSRAWVTKVLGAGVAGGE